MDDIFAQLRALVARDALQQALSRTMDLVSGAGDTIGSDVRNKVSLLWARWVALEERYRRLAHAPAMARPADYVEELDRLKQQTLDCLDILEEDWKDAPRPVVAPSVNGAVEVPSELPEPRERRINGSPFLQAAWLEEGARVAKAVCRVVTRTWTGTGFLITGGKIVTNNHVLPDEDVAQGARAQFNYQLDFLGRPLIEVEIPLAPQRLFKTAAAKDRDCTVVALGASAAYLKQWQPLALDALSIGPETAVSIVQHPDGGRKQVALSGNVVSSTDADLIYYATSTMPGSSGAPVFDDQWRVVALHQGAGQWSPDLRRYVNNRGISMAALFTDPVVGPHLR